MTVNNLKELCRLIRYDILTSTTQAGSGHPTSSLSAVELMTTLFFGGFLDNNDRMIFSKGHAAPLLYSLYHAAGILSLDQLLTLRTFNSFLEGHPTPRFPYVDVATGSLGQGLSVGVGMAMGMKFKISNLKLKIKREPRVFILLGDSEMAEGQIWEAMEIASYYKLNNLIGILDVNRLGQESPTMYGWHIDVYRKRCEAFGWQTIVVDDGHDLTKVQKTFQQAYPNEPFSTEAVRVAKPVMIIAKTVKGKGVSFLENKDGWHGRTLNKEELSLALKEIGKVDLTIRGKINKPTDTELNPQTKGLLKKLEELAIGGRHGNKMSDRIYRDNTYATREAFGDILVSLGAEMPNLVVFDAETANSTYENKFQKAFPDRFFEMFIAEENMMSAALGISKIGFVPFVSTFAAFLTQTFDQIRMAQYSRPNLKIVGSHAGVSIGADGPSQMGLEDIAMMRSILESTVFYPADAVSAAKLTRIMAEHQGIFYLRTTRGKTPVIYDEKEEFKIGGSKIHKFKISNLKFKILIIAAGITLHEALKAQKELAKSGIEAVVMDCYSIKPLDVQSINRLIKEIKNVIVVEDHYPAGGIGEAVMQALLANFKLKIKNFKFAHLCVRKIPRSGSPEELLRYEEINTEAIVKSVFELTRNSFSV